MFDQHEETMSAAAPPQQAQGPGTTLVGFESILAHVGRSLDIAAAVHADDSARLHVLQNRVAELEERMRDLDGRFTKILEERFRQAAPEAATPDLQQHYDLADAFTKFFTHVDQELSDIYRDAARTSPNARQRARWTAELLRHMCVDGGLPQIEKELLSLCGRDDSARFRIEELVGQFNELSVRAAELNPDHVLAFGSSLGPVDRDRQRAWKSCDPDGKIDFVVTPAYQVGHRVFLRQEVFTIPWQAARG